MMRCLLLLATALLLSACEIPGMGPDPRIAQREAEARAIGGACRHGLRSIEDCYNQNESASKAAIFQGWKDMDEYMRENKIDGIRASAEKAEPEEEILPDTRPKVGKDTAKPATAAPAPNKKPTDAKPAANDRPAKP